MRRPLERVCEVMFWFLEEGFLVCCLGVMPSGSREVKVSLLSVRFWQTRRISAAVTELMAAR
jgi:hypothetical protein